MDYDKSLSGKRAERPINKKTRKTVVLIVCWAAWRPGFRQDSSLFQAFSGKAAELVSDLPCPSGQLGLPNDYVADTNEYGA